MFKFHTDQTITNHSSNNLWNPSKRGEKYSENLNGNLRTEEVQQTLLSNHEQLLHIFPIDSGMLVPQKLKAHVQKQTKHQISIQWQRLIESHLDICTQQNKMKLNSTYRIYLDCLIVVNGCPRYTYKCHRFLRVCIIR